MKAALAEGEAQEAAAGARSKHAAAEAQAGRKLRGPKPKDPHAAYERAKADLYAATVKEKRRPDRADLVAEVVGFPP